MARRAIIALCLAAAALCWASAASAGEIEARTDRIRRLEDLRSRYDLERRTLEQRFAQMTAEVRRLKAERSSWNRDRRLEVRLAESKEMASLLDTRQRQVRELAAKLAIERQGLIAAIDRELGAQPPPAASRRGELDLLRADASRRLPQQPRRLRAVDTRIDPLDDPEDLEAKAADLAGSERQLREELARLDRRAAYYRRLAKLERSRRRSVEVDVFREDQPRRHTGGSKPVAASETPAGRDDASESPAPPGPPADADGGYDGALNGGEATDPSTGGGGAPGGGGAAETSVDLALVLGDVVEPGTLDELRRAERSGDPEAKARAAERARQDLAARAERLRQRRLEMEQRARVLRREP